MRGCYLCNLKFTISDDMNEQKLLVSLSSLQMRYINKGMKINWQICRKKLLGVTSDEHLKFTSHYLDELSKRVSRKIGVMMRLKNVIPTLAEVRIYKSLVLPQIKTVWHFSRKSDSRKIDSLQERALRSVVGFPSLFIVVVWFSFLGS